VSTLGIVEFLVYVYVNFQPEYDKAKYNAFTHVHFLLFYTAIINAFQSALVAFFAKRFGDKMWTNIEMMNVQQYVRAREEYELYEGLQKEQTDTSLIILRICRSILYLRTKYRFEHVQQQLQFHELRVLFLNTYEMPMRLKVTDYLRRCQETVLIKLIHVSNLAWILLASALCLFYYTVDMTTYHTQHSRGAAIIFETVFFGLIGIFIILAWITYTKCRSIVRTLLDQKLMLKQQPQRSINVRSQECEQTTLFW
jgi:hypothetical protein